jgi:hypothetical protein
MDALPSQANIAGYNIAGYKARLCWQHGHAGSVRPG